MVATKQADMNRSKYGSLSPVGSTMKVISVTGRVVVLCAHVARVRCTKSLKCLMHWSITCFYCASANLTSYKVEHFLCC